MDWDPFEIMGYDTYLLSEQEKRDRMEKGLAQLMKHHYQNCPEYARILDGLGFSLDVPHSIEEIPPVPVRLFKEFDLKSVEESNLSKTLTSSGTSGQSVSKVHLSRENARLQTKVLSNIITSYIGKKRLPLLILDSQKSVKDRKLFSARGAGIIGFSTFGRDIHYALDDNMDIQVEVVAEFFEKYQDEPILMFGYTYMLWEHFICALEKASVKFDVPQATMFHIGGWKKLIAQSVDGEAFNRRVRDVLGNLSIHNYYGMAEQLGSVFVECEQGHLHSSIFSDVLVRRFDNLAVADYGERGFLELISLLPTSYPGHVIVTEDEGTLLGVDDCPCGRLGRYFKIHGRVKGAEVRGCSDTYEKN